jgi:hypothetical protein
MLLTYFLHDFEMVPVAPIITGITLVFTFHMRCISIVISLYFNILLFLLLLLDYCWPGSSVGIATDYGLDGLGIESRCGREFLHLSRPALGPPSLLYKGYRVFPRRKLRPGRAADHLPPSSFVVMEEWSSTSTHPLGHTGPVMGLLYLYLYLIIEVGLFLVLFYSFLS